MIFEIYLFIIKISFSYKTDIFASKTTKVKFSNTSNLTQKKPKKENESPDLFDDPLFASHS
jgi:hypothetical protein